LSVSPLSVSLGLGQEREGRREDGREEARMGTREEERRRDGSIGGKEGKERKVVMPPDAMQMQLGKGNPGNQKPEAACAATVSVGAPN